MVIKKEENCLSTVEDVFLSIAKENGSGKRWRSFSCGFGTLENRKVMAFFYSVQCHAPPHSAPEEAEARVGWLP
jgi:hypothetical protein